MTEPRTWLTEIEALVARLERDYLRRCSTVEFARQHPEFAQGRTPADVYALTDAERRMTLDEANSKPAPPIVIIDHRLVHTWISQRTMHEPETIRRILEDVTSVFSAYAHKFDSGYPEVRCD